MLLPGYEYRSPAREPISGAFLVRIGSGSEIPRRWRVRRNWRLRPIGGIAAVDRSAKRTRIILLKIDFEWGRGVRHWNAPPSGLSALIDL